MTAMKKTLCALLAALLLSGCGQVPESAAAQAESAYTAGNEIATYARIDPARTQLVVARVGNIPVEELCLAFEAANADVQVVYRDITGGNSDYAPLLQWLSSDEAPDIVLSEAVFSDFGHVSEYFVNLSDDPILQRYEAKALQRTAVDSNIYWLPGPSNISAMMYNKTLFDRYGWETPATFDEFIALCDRIREDTDGQVQPWNPNAKYSNELLTVMEAFTYEELLGGVDNRIWYDDYLEGRATLAEHMGPYVEALRTLIDHGLLREEHFSYSATTRGKEFDAGQIAMVNGNVYAGSNADFDFALMPFPTTSGQLGYICDNYSCCLGVPIKEHTEAGSDAISRFIDFFSSAQGQAAYIGDSVKISNVKDVSLDQTGIYAGLRAAVDAGHMFGRMDFFVRGSAQALGLHSLAQKMTTGEVSGMEYLRELDAKSAAPEGEPEPAETPVVLATAPEDLSILETSLLMADVYRAAAGADIGLIANNVAYRGNLMRVFAGDITQKMLPVFKPRSFANDSTLVKLSMTGRQILDALDHPVGNEDVADCIYAFSGLKCAVAPWAPLGSRYLSVALADGSALEPDRLYTVAAWAGTVADEYVTGSPEAIEGVWEEHMTRYLSAAATLSPPDDGRISLVWD